MAKARSVLAWVAILLLPELQGTRSAANAEAAVDPEKQACRNPLFEKHWFSPGGMPTSLREKPAVDSDLRLCPAYNGRKSCCQVTFEGEQKLHFAYWRQILKAKIMQVGFSKKGAMQVEKDTVFSAASEQDREQYYTAARKYDDVLDPTLGHARCFAAMLVYTGGMICFACETDWFDEVEMDGGKLVRVLVNMGSCSALWAACEEFGHRARVLREAILDSKLMIRSPASVENLQMFEDQQRLCDFAHSVIAMHPFTQPSETEREATPPITDIARRRLQDNTTQEVSYATAKIEYDAMKAGKASGFEMTWDGMTAYGSSKRSEPLMALAVVASWALVRFPLHL